MPSAMTFTSLQQDAVNYTERGTTTTDPSFATQLPRMINLVERQMARELKIQGTQNVVTFALTSALDVYDKPDLWRETISINIGTVATTSYNKRVFLLPRSYEFCRTIFPDSTVTDQPEFYADYDYNHYLISPAPDYAYPVELLFWQLPPLLDDTNTTNFWTEHAPNALLHGVLREAFSYLKSQENSQIWGQQYDRDMAGLSGEDLQKILDRAQERNTA